MRTKTLTLEANGPTLTYACPRPLAGIRALRLTMLDVTGLKTLPQAGTITTDGRETAVPAGFYTAVTFAERFGETEGVAFEAGTPQGDLQITAAKKATFSPPLARFFNGVAEATGVAHVTIARPAEIAVVTPTFSAGQLNEDRPLQLKNWYVGPNMNTKYTAISDSTYLSVAPDRVFSWLEFHVVDENGDPHVLEKAKIILEFVF